jgi:peptidoglycan/xylan/chitin deacetylase (PgdA/CDA1 family)
LKICVNLRNLRIIWFKVFFQRGCLKGMFQILSKYRFARLACVFTIVTSCSLVYGANNLLAASTDSAVVADLSREFGSVQPRLWAENLPGVMRYLDYPPAEKKIALTLDACGSKNDGYDRDLIEFLAAENIPASLFVNARWIDKNPQLFRTLSANPLFDLQNHGRKHLPASVNGRSAYGLPGTATIGALVDEVAAGRAKIAGLTGVETTYFRSGTAYYDEVAIEVIQRLGQKIAGFSVLGDAGTTYTAEQIEQTLALVQANDIIIAHMNHPERQTAEGLIPALGRLRTAGFRFVTLRDAPTRHDPPAGYRQLKRNPALDINRYPQGSLK